MRAIETIPEDWLKDIRDALANPSQFKYTGWPAEGDPHKKAKREYDKIIPALLMEQYDRFDSRAKMHSRTKAEHEAAGLLNFFVIWKYSLWKAECESWDEYVRDATNMPYSISASTLKQGVLLINALFDRGMTLDNIIGVMGLTKTAARMLPAVPDEQLPGGDINAAAEIMQELGPSEAIATVTDWTGQRTYHGLSGIHDAAQERLYVEVRRTEASGAYERLDWQVNMIDADAANWFMERLGIAGKNRVFK